MRSVVVSIHAPARGATRRLLSHGHVPKGVSIHAPARGATNNDDGVIGQVAVSIHAPARGATVYAGVQVTWIAVSIHAPARGATKVELTELGGTPCFNPRTREGCDVKKI